MRPLIITLLLFAAFTCRADIAVVIAKEAAVTELSKQQVADLFLARTSRLPNGEKAFPIELKDNSLRSTFYQQVTGKSPTQLSSYWATLVFSGKGRPAQGQESVKQLIQVLEERPGSIGYLPADMVGENLTVLFELGAQE